MLRSFLGSLSELRKNFVFQKADIDEMLNIFESLYAANELQGLVDEAVRRTQRFFTADRCSLMLFNEQKKELFIKGHCGLDEAIADKCKVRLGEGVAGRVALSGRPVLVKNIEKDKHFRRRNRAAYKSTSFLSSPIIHEDKTLGVINVSEKADWHEHEFSHIDLRYLSLIARQVAFILGARQESVTDHLTGMPNFRFFTEALEREFIRSKRYSNSLCIIMIDVDEFKVYNDTFGHVEGDIILKRIAHAINRSIRASDIACRYAGDEFIIILPETEIHEAKVVAKKIGNAIDQIRSKQRVTISFGIAKQTLFMKTTKDLIRGADKALYQAKKAGKNRAFVHG